ncbi:MbtH family protein [Actinosynnema sp. NPDC047251]|uniref:MbtH-like protein n=1 Tax=Saccharothrix espanaensis (strain ATCC 51144 / DSM 44229 / JCM 9112 / NBRC 15066 / NRRL 15764) TaxID=1179773 RepID=K0K4N8_SACES|nr:MbtH family protein [Saccharothrix espanaensis]CCH31839.1 MbtH-like protein [Saccharothrix espanaensis DSM 44229]
MEPNPFEDRDATFSVLVNHEGAHSLWPSFAEIPEGWTVTLADRPRDQCDAYVIEHWTDSGLHSTPTADQEIT